MDRKALRKKIEAVEHDLTEVEVEMDFLTKGSDRYKTLLNRKELLADLLDKLIRKALKQNPEGGKGKENK